MAVKKLKTNPVPRIRVQLHTGPGLCEQAHKNECDMNYILKDYWRTGLVRHAQKHAGMYDDVSHQDFQQAMFTVAKARELFEALPADVRKRFSHDPASFLEFTSNPENRDEMKKMGILKGNDGLDFKGLPTQAPVPSEPSKSDAATPAPE